MFPQEVTFHPITNISSLPTTTDGPGRPLSNLKDGPGNGFENEPPFVKKGGSGGDWLLSGVLGIPNDYFANHQAPKLIIDLGSDRDLNEISV